LPSSLWSVRLVQHLRKSSNDEIYMRLADHKSSDIYIDVESIIRTHQIYLTCAAQDPSLDTSCIGNPQHRGHSSPHQHQAKDNHFITYHTLSSRCTASYFRDPQILSSINTKTSISSKYQENQTTKTTSWILRNTTGYNECGGKIGPEVSFALLWNEMR
jgi:hypothetical protein